MKHLFTIVLLSAVISTCYGQTSQRRHVPAFRGVIEKIQPDGDTLHTYLRGDERYHYSMTTDGWQIMENKKGVLCYAKLKRGKVTASRKVAHDAQKRKKCEQRWLKRHGIMKMDNINE